MAVRLPCQRAEQFPRKLLPCPCYSREGTDERHQRVPAQCRQIELGDTSGRGRMDRAHARHGQAPKRVLVYPLVADAQRRLVEAW